MPSTSALEMPGAGSLVSIVIPCFNYARYVGLAIDSVRRQTHARIELIVVNDGSTDASLEVMRRAAQAWDRGRIEVIDQPNQGEVAARQAGYAASHGQVVVFLDADDLLVPEALERVLRAWTEGAVKLQYDLQLIDAEGRGLGRCFAQYAQGYDAARVRLDFNRFGTYRWSVTSGNAYARAFLEQVLPQAVAGPIDGYLNTIAPLYGEVVTLAEPLGSYRLHDANDSATARRATGFPRQIEKRRLELRELRRHAERRGWQLPSHDILDHELAFLNFRLVARKLRLIDAAQEPDAPVSLMRKGLRQTLREPLSIRARMAHAAWFLAVGSLPRALVSLLVGARYGRDQWRRRWRPVEMEVR